MGRALVRFCRGLFIAAMAAGCTSPSQQSGDAPRGTVEARPASVRVTTDSPPEGRFYVLLGEGTVNDYELYELRLAPRSLTRVTDTVRVSAVGACEERVVVAAAQEEVGYSDHIQEVRGKKLVPLPGLGKTHGFTPSLATDCRVAYGWPDRTVDPPTGELRIWEPGRKEPTTLYRAQLEDGAMTNPAWGPGGEVAAVRTEPSDPDGDGPQVATGRPAAIILVRPGGSVEELDPGIDRPGILVWGSTWMAVSDEVQRATVFLDPSTRERRLLSGWVPIDWSPDGRTLLVHDFATERKLGLVHESDLSAVQEVAVLNRAVGGGVWLAP